MSNNDDIIPYEDCYVLINDLLSNFILFIKNDDELYELPQNINSFWDQVLVSDVNFKDDKEKIELFLEIRYVRALNNSFYTDESHSLITSYSTDKLNGFIKLSTDYCKKVKKDFIFPDLFDFLLRKFSVLLERDQILYKYIESGFSNSYNDICQIENNVNKNTKEVYNTKNEIERIRGNTEAIIDDAKKNINEMSVSAENSFKDLSEKMDETTRKANELSVTILGVFASIVLVFNAAVGFYQAAIEAFSHSSLHKILIILLVVGFIVINAIAILIHYLERIRMTNQDKKNKISNWLLIIFVNALIILLIGASVYGIHKGFLPNETVTDSQESTTVPTGEEITSKLDDTIDINANINKDPKQEASKRF